MATDLRAKLDAVVLHQHDGTPITLEDVYAITTAIMAHIRKEHAVTIRELEAAKKEIAELKKSQK